MRTVIVVLITMIVATPLTATVDPDPDQIGVYFDTNADVTCAADPLGLFDVYIIITRPSSEEVWDIHFNLCTVGMASKFGPVDWSPVLWVPLHDPVLCHGFLTLYASSPVPQEGANVVLGRVTYANFGAAGGTDFFIEPDISWGSGGEMYIQGPEYLNENDEWIPLGITSGDPSLPVASTRPDCGVVPNENLSFGALKSLYR